MSRFVLAKIVQARQIMSTLLPTKLSRYHYVAFFVFLIACGIVFSTGIAYAQDIAGSLIQGVSWMMLAIAKICIALTIFFLRFFITLASYNNYIDVSVVKLGWVMVRDVANMFFVVALLIIAFATILGLEQYEWKKGLVKLIIMAIFINFSNLIAQLIIDVAHVFTITFLNAISATAGGNLINMFKLEKIMSMVSGASLGNSKEEVTIEVLGASVVAVLFGIMSAVALGSYVIVMAIRVVVLWALIILSPLAYVLYAIPKGEKYAQEWWSEFTKYIIVAPVMVFFLWLAFATLGSGEILTEIKDSAGTVPLQNSDEQLKISLSEVSSWENMANYLIAMVFLMVGLKQTQATGVEGSGMVSGAVNFGKKVATIATGYAAGRWLVGKGTDTAKKGLSAGAYYFPGVGGHSWVTLGKTIKANAKAEWYRRASGVNATTITMRENLEAQQIRRQEIDSEMNKEGVTSERKAELEKEKAELEVSMAENEDTLIKASKPKGIIGRFAARGVSRAKHLRKSEGQAETLEKIASKEQTSEAGGWILNRKSAQLEAQDRRERGILKSQERRSHGKDVEYETKGELADLATPRIKQTAWGGSETAKARDKSRAAGNKTMKTMADEIAAREHKSKTYEDEIKILLTGAEAKIEIDERVELQKALDKRKEAERLIMDPNELTFMDQIDALEAQRIDALKKAEKKANDNIKEKGEKIDHEIYSTDVIKARKALEEYRNSSGYNTDKDDASARTAWEEKVEQEHKADNELNNLGVKISSGESEIATLKEAYDKAVKDYQEAKTAGNYSQDDLKVFEETGRKALGDLDAKNVVQKELEAKRDEKERYYRDRKSMTSQEAKLADNIVVEEKRRSENEEYKKAQKAYEELVEEKKKTVRTVNDASDTQRKDIEGKLKTYKDSDEYNKKKRDVDPNKKAEYDTIMAETDHVIDHATERLRAQMGAKLGEQRVKTASARLEATALGTRAISELFEGLQIEEQFEEAAKKIKDSIKDANLAKIFKKGAKDLESAAKEIGRRGDKFAEKIYRELGVGAQAVHQEVKAEYAATLTKTQRDQVKDIADGQYSLSRFGFETPSSAFKNLIKKRMDETFTGVEREQAVLMAMGSFGKLVNIRQKDGEMDIDHQAQMMANVNHLVKQAWSDDFLARIVGVINNKNKLGGAAREEAENLMHIFGDQLKWGRQDTETGDFVIDKNISSNQRTNDLHRLTSFSGDLGLLQSENAVLRTQEKNKGKGMGYLESGKNLAEVLREKLTDDQIKNNTSSQWDAMARNMGLLHETAGNEIQAFAKKFVSGMTSASESVSRFEEEVRKYGEANEVMADFKNMALAVGHLDDGGHTYFDMDDKMARGQLASNAMNFVLSDWRKMSPRDRMRKLKVHTIAQMDEESGTIYLDAHNKGALGDSFQGMNRLSWGDLDARTKNQLAGGSAGEEFEVDSLTGRRRIGAKSGDMYKETFKDAKKAKHAVEVLAKTNANGLDKILKQLNKTVDTLDNDEMRQIATLSQIADNYAVALDTKAGVIAAAIGEKTGIDYDSAVQGKFQAILGDDKLATSIDSHKDLFRFVQKFRSNTADIILNERAIDQEFQNAKEAARRGGNTNDRREEDNEPT